MKIIFYLLRLIGIIIVFLCLSAKVVYPADIPEDVIQCIKHLTRNDYDLFAKFCADTVLFGQAFTDNCGKMAKRQLIKFLKKNRLSRENRDLFQKFPNGFEIVWDRKKGEIVCYRLSRPYCYLVFRQEEKIWKLKVLGIHFPEPREDK